MQGLNHNIIYRKDENLLIYEWKKIKYNPLSIDNINILEEDFFEIHDDILKYFIDYFNWIKMYNPSKNEQINGFCYWGITIIKNENIKDLKILIDSIINIFENSPKEIILTGCYNLNNKKYKEININKNKLLEKLNKFIFLIEKAIKNGGYILHCGI
jgi:hypothetical protein